MLTIGKKFKNCGNLEKTVNLDNMQFGEELWGAWGKG